MDVSDAIRTAKDYVNSVFKDDGIADIGLEEIEYDHADDAWSITIGFVRPRGNPHNPLAEVLDRVAANRLYKVVKIANASGQPLSLKNRPSE